MCVGLFDLHSWGCVVTLAVEPAAAVHYVTAAAAADAVGPLPPSAPPQMCHQFVDATIAGLLSWERQSSALLADLKQRVNFTHQQQQQVRVREQLAHNPEDPVACWEWVWVGQEALRRLSQPFRGADLSAHGLQGQQLWGRCAVLLQQLIRM